MTKEELIAYLLSYIKLCKVKGDPYILVYMGFLYLVDEDISTLYIVPIDHALPNISTRYSKLNNDNEFFDISIMNLMKDAISRYASLNMNDFKKISRCEVNYDIPARAADNCRRTLYYFDEDPTAVVIIPEFYGMVPITKADKYEMYYKTVDDYSSIIMYRIIKAKRKAEITMYRRVLNLPK